MKIPKFPMMRAEYGSPLKGYWSGYLRFERLEGSLWAGIAKHDRGEYTWQVVWETFTAEPTVYKVLAEGEAESLPAAEEALHRESRDFRALYAAQIEGVVRQQTSITVDPRPRKKKIINRRCPPCRKGKHDDCTRRVLNGGCCDGVSPSY